MESSSISLTGRRLNVRRYIGIVACTIQGIFRRQAKPPGAGRDKDSREAWQRKEQYQAEAISQIQFLKIIR